MLSEKEKMTEELRFLKESYDIGVITAEEYENGRRRIEAKINAAEEKENEGSNLFKEEFQKTDEAKVTIYDAEEKEERQEKLKSIESDDEEKESKRAAAKPSFLRKKKEIKQEENQDKYETAAKISQEEEKDQTEEDVFPLDFEEKKKAFKEKKEWKEEKPEDEIELGKKTLVFAAVLIIAALGIWYFFFTGNSADSNIMPDSAAALIACHSDNDCTEKKKIGNCLNPGKENAECRFIDDIEVKLSIITSKECFNCDTGRIISILEGFYPNLDIEEIDYDTTEGRAFAGSFNINALPAYILNSSLSEAHNYEKFSSAFNKVKDNFVMKDNVANANYYIEREEIPDRLDLFVQDNQEASAQAEANLREFLDAFGGKATFNKHNSDSALAGELGLNSFPAFLINNKIKFGGVQAADTIKENFCRMNKLQECSLELPKSLI